MAQVKVWNDNIHPYEEKFREKHIKIPARKFVLMEEGEAQLFKCGFAPIKIDADGNPIPEGYKMIRLEKLPDSSSKVEDTSEFVCQMDGSRFDTQEDLDKYIEENFKDQIITDPEAEKVVSERKKKKLN